MGDDLRARLESHSRAFEGMMSLIPAKQYYAEDNSDQWQRKKQTKEQKRRAKKAKLEPGAYKSALDVHKENERKRKRDEDDERELQGDNESRGEKARTQKQAMKKKQKLANGEPGVSGEERHQKATESDEEARRAAKAERRKEKRERKKEKKAKKLEKREAKKARKAKEQKHFGNGGEDEPLPTAIEDEALEGASEHDADEAGGGDGNAAINELEFEVHDIESEQGSESSAVSTPLKGSPTFDAVNTSSASSTSSIQPPSEPQRPLPASSSNDTTESQPKEADAVEFSEEVDEETDKTPTQGSQSGTGEDRASKLPTLPHIDQEALRERIQARINALRAERKADGPDGKPARSRQELIEARRRKEEQRKQHKKELRAKARLEEQQQQQHRDTPDNDVEAEAARLRGGSDSPLWDNLSPREPENYFSFGRVAFSDGAQLDPAGAAVRDPWQRRKGPSDPKTALAAAQKKKARLDSLDADSRAEVSDKDRWLNAARRAHGAKVKDDANLLMKTLKRKQKAKAKSEKEWTDRLEGVKKGKDVRQRKREDNLLKRRDEKGGGAAAARGKGRFGIKFGGAGAGRGSGAGGPVKKRRPGFEGTFKSGGSRKP